jgi:hypothetical protein
MNIDQIATILKDASAGGTLDLAPDAFGTGGALPAFMRTYIGTNGHLTGTVQSIQEDQSQDRVILVMAGTSPPVDATTVTAWFYDHGDGVQLYLTATATDTWLFSKSFPVFGPGFLDTLPLSGVVLQLVSDPTLPDDRGQFFAAMLGLPAEIGWLFGGLTSLSLAGPIGVDQGIPVFSFVVPIASPVTIGTLPDLVLSFALTCRSVTTTVAQLDGGLTQTVNAPVLSMGLGATVRLGGLTGGLFIDLVATTGLIAAEISVAATSVALSDFAALVAHADLTGSLPAKSVYDPGADFARASVTLLVDPGARKLQSVDLILEARPQWPILDRTILTDIRFQLTVFDPLGGKQITAGLSATVAWPGGSLVVGGTAPNVTLYCALTPGSKISLADVLDRLLKTDVPPSLAVNELSLTVAPRQGSFDVVTGISGDWQVDLGITGASLQHVWAEVQRSGGTTTGSIAAKAIIGNFNVEGSWQIPGEFSLQGELREAVNLNALIATLTNSTLPDGIPTILITQAAASITVVPSSPRLARALRATGGTVYSFAATATAATERTQLGTVLFVVRKADTGFGFVTGFVVPETWSPGDLLPELKSLFDSLTFTNTGLIISSIKTDRIDLPNLKQPSLPSSISPGLIAFTSLALARPGLSQLGGLFDGAVTLDLSAQLDMATPVNSVIVASLRAIEAKGALTYLDFRLVLKPAAASFSLSIAVRLALGDQTVTVQGVGIVALEPPSFAIGLIIENWVEPFGIKGLTIVKFGIGIMIGGGGIAINFLGRFLIGQGDRRFSFTIGGGLLDFEVPSAIIFALDATDHTLMLTDLIGQFTDLDLSDVPVLSHIGFRHLDFAIVDDPSGFTIGDEHFPPGIRIDADITIYDWNATFELAVNTNKGIYAKGAIDKPIVIGDKILVISDVGGQKGPSGLIDTSAFVSGQALVRRGHIDLRDIEITPETLLVRGPSGLPLRITEAAATYFELDASISLLGVAKQALKVSVSKTTFDFFYDFEFLGIKENLTCHFSQAEKNFAATAHFSFNLDVQTPALVIAGVEVLPSIHLQAPSASLDLSLGFSWSGAISGGFGLAVSFGWRGVQLSFVASVSLADIANSIANLWNAMATWIKANVLKVFAAILGNIGDYIAAIKNGLFQFAGGALALARALVALFDAGAQAVAEALCAIGYGFEAIVDTLVDTFKLAVNAAVDIARALFGQCSLAAANGLLFGPLQTIVDPRFVLPPKILTDLARKPMAHGFLVHYYQHQSEIRQLLAQDHVVRRSLHNLAQGFAPAGTPIAPHLLNAMSVLEVYGSPELRDSVRHLQPQMELVGDLTYAELLAVLPDR